jgi:erythromycin esterase-like protein
VTAARDWGDPAERRRVTPSIAGSFERLFHDTGLSRFLLLLRDDAVRHVLRAERLERAIGVIYRPDTERASHDFRARLSEQFDAIVHVDETRALDPLERWSRDEIDLPETYPSGV